MIETVTPMDKPHKKKPYKEKTYEVRVVRHLTGYIYIKAKSRKQAIEKAQEIYDYDQEDTDFEWDLNLEKWKAYEDKEDD